MRRLAIVALLILALSSNSFADDKDPPPLRPSDTSSPRDTLRSFLDLTEALVSEYRAEGATGRVMTLLRGARDTLDFANTHYGAHQWAQIQRVLMLHDILARIEIPSDDEIPGDADVADGKLERWTIPGTRLVIARLPSGNRQGEFVFSAETVENLDLDRRRVKHLPAKSGAALLYEEEQANPGKNEQQRQRLARRFRAVDASSPRATLEGLLHSVHAAYKIATEAEAALTASPPTMTAEEARKADGRAHDLLQGAASLLDLSEVPPIRREDTGLECAILLKEVFDRSFLPGIAFVPSEAMVNRAREPGVPYTWRMPGTEIVIVEMTSGDRAGEFLFSSRTVSRIREIYERVKDLPYRPPLSGELAGGYADADISADFYEYYSSTPGRLVPSATFLGRFIDGLPGGLKTRVLGVQWWQGIGLAVLLLMLFLLVAVLRRVGLAVAERRTVLGRWLSVLTPLILAAAVEWAADVADEEFGLTGGALATVRTLAGVVAILLAALVAWRLIRAVAETVLAGPGISTRGIDAGLMRIVTGMVAFVVAVIIVVSGLQRLGVDATPLLASLGIGGLAVAFAVRPTLENLISGLILYADKPVRVGDLCTYGGKTGTIERIGIRSTLIRASDRTLISVPNSKFASSEVINWAPRDRMLIQATIELRGDTTPDQLRYVLAKMREMCRAHPKIDSSTIRIRVVGFGPSALEINIRIYALTRDFDEFFAVREDVYLRMVDIIADAGTDFANPSRTLYLARDEGLDSERSEAAAAQVEAWRQSGELPFPGLRDTRAQELEGTLDYPPRGSTDHPSGGEDLDTEEPELPAPQERSPPDPSAGPEQG